MTSTTIETVKEKLPIVDVISSYIAVERSGVNAKARCPFHREKTASFFISPDRNTFYCFGCGAKGDIFSFVEKMEGVDFMGALKILAGRAGVPLTFERKEEDDGREKLFKLMEDATLFFEEKLRENIAPQDYIKNRGLTEDTIRLFRIGYAPNEWRMLRDHLIAKGYSEEQIESVGLIKKSDGDSKRSYDRFRGRIMFPIADSSGRIVAYSGRIFDKPTDGSSEPAKYMNSPETPLYHKSSILYGFDKAKDGMRRLHSAIVVEGQMDLVLSHQAGFTNSVALSGTALTVEQMTLIERFTKNILLALDADAAGMSAAGKSAILALSRGCDVKVVHIRGGKDPADIIKEDPQVWKDTVKSAVHVIEFYLDVIEESESDERNFRRKASSAVVPFLAMMPAGVDRAHFVEKVANRLKIVTSAVEAELDKYLSSAKHISEIKHEAVPQVEMSHTEALISEKDRIIRRLIGLLSSSGVLSDKTKADLDEGLKKILGEDVVTKLKESDEYSAEAVFAIENEPKRESTDAEVRELLLRLRRAIIVAEEFSLRREIAEREARGESSDALLSDYQSKVKERGTIEELIRASLPK